MIEWMFDFNKVAYSWNGRIQGLQSSWTWRSDRAKVIRHLAEPTCFRLADQPKLKDNRKMAEFCIGQSLASSKHSLSIESHWMTQEPQKRRRSKKTEEAKKPVESSAVGAPAQPKGSQQSQEDQPLPLEEKEERIAYIAWWLARNGLFATDVHLEIQRKYNLTGKAAQEIVAAARTRHEAWEKASPDARRNLADQWWISVFQGADATLPQKMHAMECWQELHGLLRPAEVEKGAMTIHIIEQVITDRSQIRRDESSTEESNSLPVAATSSALAVSRKQDLLRVDRSDGAG